MLTGILHAVSRFASTQSRSRSAACDRGCYRARVDAVVFPPGIPAKSTMVLSSFQQSDLSQDWHPSSWMTLHWRPPIWPGLETGVSNRSSLLAVRQGVDDRGGVPPMKAADSWRAAINFAIEDGWLRGLGELKPLGGSSYEAQHESRSERSVTLRGEQTVLHYYYCLLLHRIRKLISNASFASPEPSTNCGLSVAMVRACPSSHRLPVCRKIAPANRRRLRHLPSADRSLTRGDFDAWKLGTLGFARVDLMWLGQLATSLPMHIFSSVVYECHRGKAFYGRIFTNCERQVHGWVLLVQLASHRHIRRDRGDCMTRVVYRVCR